MQVRKPFAAAFIGLSVIAAFLGLAPQSSGTIPHYAQSDKVLHAITFFLLTLAFYWILETSRRRAIHYTLIAVTGGLSIGSEILQSIIPNGRVFDPLDIAANVIGSGGALFLCSWYHKRMLERKRAARSYNLAGGNVDIELGDNEGQESGVVNSSGQTVSEQLDNWDENAEDWEDGGVNDDKNLANADAKKSAEDAK